MKSNLSIGKLSAGAAMVIGLTLAVYSFATPVMSQQQGVRVTQRAAQSYAQLTIQGDAVTWDPGGNDIPRVDSLAVTYRRLGGNQRPSLVNLLNVIGTDGWELVLADNNVWTFKK